MPPTRVKVAVVGAGFSGLAMGRGLQRAGIDDFVIREGAVVGADGVAREVDTIILGTGYHVTDMPLADLVTGRDGRTLADVYGGGPRAYLGTAVPGFPNLFLLLGPNTGLGHSSMVYMIESQVDHVLRLLRAMRRRGADTVEVRADRHDEFNRWVDERLRRTVWETGGCTSFYRDATGRNATLWPDWTWRFRRRTRRRVTAGYDLTTTNTKATTP
ncbi:MULTISPECIES: hypothetical protein [unclassified Nocardiopsis]|uniref:hypothetical protein n=1 Tax=Nocardiopsis TaxID=2013 RepID=UPI00387B6EE8